MNLQVRGVSLSEVSLCSLAGGNGSAVAVIRCGVRPGGDLRAHPGGINDSNSIVLLGPRPQGESRSPAVGDESGGNWGTRSQLLS